VSAQRFFPTTHVERARRAALLAVLLLDVLVTAWIARQIVAYRNYPFATDEAFHANGGLTLALDLRAGDLGAFVVDSYHQSAYPPAFSWLQAPVFLVLGASPMVARLCSLATLFAAVLVMYAIGLELDAEHGWLVGLVSAGLTLTAQPVLSYSAMAMLEVPGLLISLVALWAYLRAVRQPSARWLVLTSLLMALAVLTKYPYGTVIVPTIVVMEALAVLVRAFTWRQAGRRWLWLFGPLVLVMVAWFARPYKIAAFFEYATSQSQQVSLLSPENLLYYPRSLMLHYAPSPVAAVLTLAGVIWAITRWRDHGPRLFLVYFAIGLLEMTVKLQKHPRFILTFAPAAHVLTGAMLAWFLSANRRNVLIALAVALTICIVASAPMLAERFSMLPPLMQVLYETDPAATDLSAWIAAHVPAEERFYLVNPWDQFSAPAMEWYRATHSTKPGLRWEDIWVPSQFLEKSRPENLAALQHAIRASGAQYLVALEGGPEGEQVWPAYADAMGDMIVPVEQHEFPVEQWRPDVARWIKTSLLTREGLEGKKSAGRYTMHIQATVYRVAGP
jgi:4-amino-4-deoxy-L-arabinose transferase-like glycosyltransferase